MRVKLSLFVVIAALAIPVIARAQEGSPEDRHEYFQRLRMACEDGDEHACRRLREMRRERHEREEREWGERGEGGPPYAAAPGVNNKAALCSAIQNNFNNCVARQQSNPGQPIDCNAWPLELKANGCF
jgi:hypothetical protein